MSEITITIGDLSFNTDLHRGKSFYKVNNTDELLCNVSVRHSDTPLQGRHGMDDTLSKYGPRILSFQGEIVALTPTIRVTMEQAMRKALSIPPDQNYTDNDGTLEVVVDDEDGNQKRLFAKVIEAPSFRRMGERKEQMREFRFTLYAKDPVMYGTTQTTASGTEKVLGTSFSFVQGSSPKFPLSLYSVTRDTLTIDNDGNYPTPLVFTIAGPTVDPVVTNVTTGKQMAFTGLTLTSGQSITVDALAGTVVNQAGDDYSGYIDTDVSDWIFLPLGTNELTLVDSTSDDLTAALSAYCYPAWM